MDDLTPAALINLLKQEEEAKNHPFSSSFNRKRAHSMALFTSLTYEQPSEVDRVLEQQLKNVYITHFYYDGQYCGYGVVSRKRIVIALRGTRHLEDWLRNILVWKNFSGIHQGWHAYANGLWSQIMTFVRENTDYPLPLYVTGHSMGGAAALLITEKINVDDYCPFVDQTYTFGAPCVDSGGSSVLVTTPLFRLRNAGDIVPFLTDIVKGYWDYYHMGLEYVIEYDGDIYVIDPEDERHFLLGNLATMINTLKRSWSVVKVSWDSSNLLPFYEEHKMQTYRKRLKND